MKGKVKGKIIALASLALASLMAFTTAVTAAAFFNYELHQQEIVIDMGYGKYFAGGNGTVETPYLIGNSEHLRNLSKLTAMGVLGKDDHFQLSQDITYAGEPLLPIGTFHSPFFSQFDGQDHSITDLVVTGTDQQDVGMFGYAAVGSSIKNFRLNNPVIKAVTSASNAGKHTYASMDNNILRSSISESFVKSFNLYPANLTQVNEYVSTFTQFAIKYTSKDTAGNDILPAGFKLSYSISDSFIKEATVTLPTESAAKADETAIGFQFDSTVLDKTKFALIDFFVEGIVKGKDGKYQYARFNVERFKIYGVVGKDKDGKEIKYLVQKDVDGNDWKKIIHSKPDIIEATPGVFQYDYIEHKKYVGIIVGNLEGDIDRVLVYEPKMVIEGGPFASNSYLVGNHIDDNRKSPLSKHKIDTSNLPNSLTYKAIDDASLHFNNVEDARILTNIYTLNRHRPSNNKVIPEIYNENGRNGMIAPASKDAIRLFGTNNVNDKKQQKVKVVQNKYKTTTPSDQTAIERKALSITGDMSGKVAYFNTPILSGFIGVPTASCMVASNALQLWATATEDTKGFWQQLFAGNRASFVVNVELDYVYFDDNFTNTAETTFEEENKLAMLSIEKRTGTTTTSGLLQSGDSVYTLPSTYPQDPAVGDLLPMNNVGGGNNLLIQYRPVDPKSNTGTVNLDKHGKYPLRFFKEDISGVKPDAQSTYEIKTKEINLTVNMPNTGALFTPGTHTPLFLLGMKTGTLGAKYRLDIFGIRITISDKAGNFAATVLNVDFSNDPNATIPATADFQKEATKTRVKTTLYDDSKELNNATDETPLAVNAAAANGCGTYIIKVSRGTGSSKRVTFYYKTTAAIKNAKKIPTNIQGFTDATIREDTSLTA